MRRIETVFGQRWAFFVAMALTILLLALLVTFWMVLAYVPFVLFGRKLINDAVEYRGLRESED